jgi:hypothetical protein
MCPQPNIFLSLPCTTPTTLWPLALSPIATAASSHSAAASVPVLLGWAEWMGVTFRPPQLVLSCSVVGSVTQQAPHEVGNYMH